MSLLDTERDRPGNLSLVDQAQLMATDFKQTLRKAADKLRAQMDAAEYKHIVLGLIFLKYISDTFVKQQDKVKSMVSEPSSDYFSERISSPLSVRFMNSRRFSLRSTLHLGFPQRATSYAMTMSSSLSR